jgi:2-dehydro-3-deoxyphosphogluconate aldolase/(4S)-4-hydroxy-2-oxoglutarate aldolase
MQESLNNILNQKIIPVYSHAETGMNKKALVGCYRAGLRYFEFTNRHENAMEEFYALKKYCEKELPGMILGAGTIKNIPDAEMFLSAGAEFLVSPLISKILIDFTKTKKISWIPGCATASEVGLAENNGIQFVKIFPAKQLGGPAFIDALKGPYPNMKFLATGGITGELSEIKNYLAFASAVGIGNSFFSGSMDENEITNKIKNILSNI